MIDKSKRINKRISTLTQLFGIELKVKMLQDLNLYQIKISGDCYDISVTMDQNERFECKYKFYIYKLNNYNY